MDVCIFYFSGTGNTKWVAEKLTGELAFMGRSAQCHSIEQLDGAEAAKLIENSDVVLFGFPIYGSCVPEPMQDFINNLPESSKSRKAGLFCTQMVASGDGAWHYHRVVEEKGFDINWTYHFRMPNNICFRLMPLPYSIDPVKINKILDKCMVKIKKAAAQITQGTSSYTGNGFGSLLLGLLQRPYYIKLIKKPFKSPYEVDMAKCTKCMRCIQICAAGNIRLVNGEITFGTECVLCMRCYNFCPVVAIKAYGKSHDPDKPPYRGPNDFDPALITKPKNLHDYLE